MANKHSLTMIQRWAQQNKLRKFQYITAPPEPNSLRPFRQRWNKVKNWRKQ